MCLVYNAREATRDIVAIFEATNVIRKLVIKIATEEHLPKDWLNDTAKAYISPGFNKEEVLELSHLRVWAPEP